VVVPVVAETYATVVVVTDGAGAVEVVAAGAQVVAATVTETVEN